MSRKTFVAILAGSMLVVGTWAWAQQAGPGQQPMGPMGQGGQPGGGMGPGMMGPGQPGPQGGPGGMMMGGMGQPGGSPFERPLISEILSATGQLNLTADQQQKLRRLRTDFEKEAIKRGAKIQVAEVDLRELLAAEAPDLGKVEAQTKKIAALQGDLRFARIKVLQEGRALLSHEQWQKFEALASRPGQPGHGMGPGGMMGPGRGRGPRQRGGMGQPGMQGMPGQPGPSMGPGMGMMMGGQQAAAGGANAAARTDANGPVTVIATLLPPRGERIAFEVKLDTHSVELDGYTFETGVALRNDRGESAPPVVESPTGSGHHRAITLAFPGGLAGGGAKRLELIVRDLGGVKERVLRWDAPFAGN